jgi:hypothetical protein
MLVSVDVRDEMAAPGRKISDHDLNSLSKARDYTGCPLICASEQRDQWAKRPSCPTHGRALPVFTPLNNGSSPIENLAEGQTRTRNADPIFSMIARGF